MQNIIDQVEGEAPEDDPTDDPVFVEGVNAARKMLYEDGLAQKVNSIMKKHPDPASQLASLAYELSTKADEMTQGRIQDDNLVSLGAFILAEVGEIAESSGAKFEPSDMAGALKQMLVRYVEESGADPGGVQEAMNAIPAKQFTALHNKVMESEDAA